MDLITLFACAMGGCIVGFLVASFSDSKIIRGLQDDNRELKRKLIQANSALKKAEAKPEVTEIRTYTADPHGFDALYKPF